jgi:hypothetical protein
MAPEPRSRVALLAVLAVILAGVVAYQLWSPPSAVDAPASNGAGARDPRSARASGGQPGSEAPDVHLQELEAERPKPDAQRNLFRFKPKAPPPAPPPPPNVQQQPVPTGPVTPGIAPITLKYIGFVGEEKGGKKIAALVDQNGHQIRCLEGQDCDGRYHIWRIGVESVDISYLDGTGRRSIRASGG